MPRAQKGFSLIEIMVVVAIIAILAALSVAAYGRIGAASAPRNAINDLTAALTRARTSAIETQSDVWVIFYPTFDKRTPATTGGPGAYFTYQDKQGTFNNAAGGAGEVYYRAGTGGVNFDPVAGTLYGSPGNEGRLIDSVYLDDYPGKNVLLALPASGPITMAAKDLPFATLLVNSACTFCLNAGVPRGAIIFGPDGSARFVDSVGGAVAVNGALAVNRAQALVLKNTTETRLYVVAVSGPTAYIGMYDKL